MESQLHHHPQDTGLHSGEGHGQVHDEGEHHHKTSVLKKVKAKAKKIKDHLKHGLGHDHEHEQDHHRLHGDEEEEEETDDEEMEEGAEVHGGPYAIRSKDIKKEDLGPSGNLENPTSPKEDHYDSKMKNEELHRPTLQRQDEFARPPSLEGTHFPQVRHTPHVTTAHGNLEHENIGAPIGLEHSHAAHFGEEMRRPPTGVESDENKGFDHVTTHGKHEHHGLQGHEHIEAPTGLANYPHASHFREEMHRPLAAAADTRKSTNIDYSAGHGRLENQGLHGGKIGVLTGIEEDPHAPKDHPDQMNPNPTNYQSKVTDPTGANNEEAVVGPLVRSFDKMGVNDVPETAARQGTEGMPGPAGDTKFDRVTERKQYTGSHNQFAPPETPTDFPSVPEDTESTPKSMNPSKPEELPQDTLAGKPGSYTEKISSATSAIADKAVAAKNVVASKLGYSGTEKTTSATELAQQAASTVAEKLAPVYEKVAVAGSTVMAKVQGGNATGETRDENRGGADTEHEVKIKDTDKGVSMKEYLVEKFRPGEEDKALSEVISGSLSRQKDKTEETGVTESEEVKRRLGPIEDTKKEEEEEEEGGSGESHVGEGFGQGVVDRVKGAVSTWLGKGGQTDSNVDGGAVVGGRG